MSEETVRPFGVDLSHLNDDKEVAKPVQQKHSRILFYIMSVTFSLIPNHSFNHKVCQGSHLRIIMVCRWHHSELINGRNI